MKKKYPCGANRSDPDLRNIKLSRVQSTLSVPSTYFCDESQYIDDSSFRQLHLGACQGHAWGWHVTFWRLIEDAMRNYFFNLEKLGTRESDFKAWYTPTNKTFLAFRTLANKYGGILACLPSNYSLSNSSARYVYGKTKLIDGFPNLEGTWDNFVMKTLANGCATIKTVPNNTRLSHYEYVHFAENSVISDEAKQYKLTEKYVFVDDDCSAIESAIYQNGGFPCTISVGNYKSPIKKGKLGYHKVWVCGYGYSKLKLKNGKVVGSGKKSGRIFFKNWWDTDSEVWGIKGYGYFDLNRQQLSDMRLPYDLPNEIIEEAKALPTIRLTRRQSDAAQTLGDAIFSYNGKTMKAYSLELKWLNNAKNISCIPTGSYECRWEYSKKYNASRGGMWILRLYDISGRTNILVHPFNYYTETQGCIGFGEQLFDINNDKKLDITNTIKTIQKIYSFFEGKNCTMIIK